MSGIAENVRNILLLEAFADEARRLAAARRAELDAKARRQLEEDGVAPSWALPAIAKVTLGVTKQAAYVSDVAKLTAWAVLRHPQMVETVQQLRPADLTRLLASLDIADGVPVDTATGEIVPGVAVREGGKPDRLSIRPDSGVRAALAGTVQEMLATAHPAIAGRAEPVHVPDDPWISGGDPFAVFPAGDAA